MTFRKVEPNPAIVAAQRRVGIRLIDLRIERLAAALEDGRITRKEHDARRIELEARK